VARVWMTRTCTSSRPASYPSTSPARCCKPAAASPPPRIPVPRGARSEVRGGPAPALLTGQGRFLQFVQKARYDGTMSSTDHTAALRGAGLRVTAPRLATLAVVEAHPHSDAESIARSVRESLGTVSRQAGYDVLH